MRATLLVASPQMKDPYFERTVVLVWHHDADGAIGVVVNKPLPHRFADLIEIPTAAGPIPGYFVHAQNAKS